MLPGGMRDLYSLAPDEVLRVYFSERRRRENPPSLAGLDPDAPKEKKPQDGRYEELVLLTKGVDPTTLAIMYEASGMWRTMASKWRCPVEDCWQFIDHKHSDVVGTDGNPLTVGGQTITEPVTNHVPAQALADRYGLTHGDVKTMVKDALDVVAENMGRRRGATRAEYVEDPAVESWRAWCSRGGV